ncbi:MAG: glycoside hydrolase family 28 protein [Paludibacter sp.]|nr:glycoside hydrolase family 28 protein [Paludibacter sp.]
MKRIYILSLSFIILFHVHAQWQSALVNISEQGDLTYNKDSKGFIIPDFSNAGYKNGQDIPDRTRSISPLEDSTADNTAHIEAIIDQVSEYSLDDNGFRGVVYLSAGNDQPLNLMIHPASVTPNSALLIWDKPIDDADIKGYEIYKNNEFLGFSYKTNFTVNDLIPDKIYTFYIKSKHKTGEVSQPSVSVAAKTKSEGKIINVLDYGAIGDGVTLNTEKIQKAIDNCPEGSSVYIPEGVFLSGALFLKSNMTLYIEKNGVLKGSIFANDYKPIVYNRFEGWETKTYASLINAGKMDKNGECTVSNVIIRGEGKIIGGGMALSGDMIASKGMRGRGRLICLMNCSNVFIQGLTIEDSPCWTIHYIYSKNIILEGLTINSIVRNGDGIDPDSSTDSYILNCIFNTNDDCIAIKSGKNPEGYYIGRPSENIHIFNCLFIKGHGISIGSEMSGGIKNIEIRDCVAKNLMHGLQIKATKERGGVVENIRVKDCILPCIRVFTSVNYNNDGISAPETPLFKNFEFSDINIENKQEKPVIIIEGFSDKKHYTKNLLFENIVLPENSVIQLSHVNGALFKNVKCISGNKPEYIEKNTFNIKTNL